jgi:hypothetical protein
MILTDARVKNVHFTEDTIGVDLMDGRSEDEVESLSNVVYLHVFQPYESPARHGYREAA